MWKYALSLIFIGGLNLTGQLFSRPTQVTEGKITYSVEVVKSDLNYLEEMAINLSTLTISFKDEAIRTDFGVAISGTTIIQDSKANKGLMLLDVLGTKKAVQLGETKEEQIKPNITYLDETKTIAGYACKKAIITVDDSTQLTAYYTDQISPENKVTKYTYGNLKGFPLEMQVDLDGTLVNLKAESVDASAQDASDFSLTVPEGYELTTMQELEKLTGGK